MDRKDLFALSYFRLALQSQEDNRLDVGNDLCHLGWKLTLNWEAPEAVNGCWPRTFPRYVFQIELQFQAWGPCKTQIRWEAYVLCIICRVILPLPCICWMLYSPEQGLGNREKGGRYTASQDSGNKMPACQERGQAGGRKGSLGITLPLSQARLGLPCVGWDRNCESQERSWGSVILPAPIDWCMGTTVTSPILLTWWSLSFFFFFNSIAITHADSIYHQSPTNVLTHRVLFPSQGWNNSWLLLVYFRSYFTFAQQRD